MRQKKIPPTNSSSEFDPVDDYALKVRAGTIVASRWVRLACDRHLRDRQREDDLFWDLAAAKKIFRFFTNVLRLNGGQFEGKPFDLLPFEQFIVGSLFGWKMPDGTRRFRTAYIEIGKGNGKSPLAAGVGMAGLIADKEARAEIYAAATKKDQAMILFRDAVAMRDQSPDLRIRLKKSGIGEKCWNLAYHETGSWFRPISSDEDSQSGPRPHMALVDEVHEHKSNIVISMLDKGFKWRRNPLMMMITNSGTARESVCWDYHEYVSKILKQTVDNDRLFGFICALDACEKHWNEGQEQPVDNCAECDDWRSYGPHWEKANPAIDKIISRKTIEDDVVKAIGMPSEENNTRRLHFCYWTATGARWISMELWDQCGQPIDFKRLAGRSCVVGLDLSIDKDITALVLLFPPEDLPLQATNPEAQPDQAPEDAGAARVDYMFIDFKQLRDDFIVVPYLFMPKEILLRAERSDNVPYTAWERAGHIQVTEGNTVDYGAVRQKLIALQEIYPVKTIYDQKTYETSHLIGYDPYNAREFSNSMQKDFGINMIEIRQGFPTLSEPTKQLTRLLKAGKIRHGGHPVLRWMADNVVTKSDPNNNLMPDKRKAKKHIDGISALINAFSLVIRNLGGDSGRSVYEDRGVLRV